LADVHTADMPQNGRLLSSAGN